MDEEYAKKLIKKMLQDNPQIDKCFSFLVEEFLLRLREQYNLPYKDFVRIVNKYYDLESIKFDKIDNDTTIGRFSSFAEKYGDTWTIANQKITINKNEIKRILLFDENAIHKLINTFFHEQGHFVQVNDQAADYLQFGLQYRKSNGQRWHGSVLNEFAETINADVLEYGNTYSRFHLGYESIQDLARAIIGSIGISERQLVEYQNMDNARSNFNELLKQRIGPDYKVIISGLEDSLDTAYALYTRYEGRIKDANYMKNMKEQFKTVEILTNEILNRRMEYLIPSDITEIAQVACDKGRRDVFFLDSMKRLHLRYKPNLMKNFTRDSVDDIGADRELVNKEIHRLLNQELEDLDEASKTSYDNDQLKEQLYMACRQLDLSNLPIKDRIEIGIAKKIGELKRLALNKDIPAIPEATIVEETTNISRRQRLSFEERLNARMQKKIEKEKNLESINEIESRDDIDESTR